MPYWVEHGRVLFETSGWLGEIALASTGNLIRLHHRPTGMEIFRFPVPEAELADHPAVFGMPLLLPPNRIRDGVFSAGGRIFRFPVNEAATNCFLHGLFLGLPFELTAASECGSSLLFRLSRAFTADDVRFSGFPCEFSAEIVYELTSSGLSHRLTIRNRGGESMPLGVGFHTAFCTPESEHVTLDIPRDPSGPWAVHALRRLPSGEKRPWTPAEEALLSGRKSVEGIPVSAMFSLPEAARTVRIHRKNGTVRYELDPLYTHLACWNDGGTKEFFCIEPMSWMTDAPNVPLPDRITGFSMLPPGSARTFTSLLSVE